MRKSNIQSEPSGSHIVNTPSPKHPPNPIELIAAPLIVVPLAEEATEFEPSFPREGAERWVLDPNPVTQSAKTCIIPL